MLGRQITAILNFCLRLIEHKEPDIIMKILLERFASKDRMNYKTVQHIEHKNKAMVVQFVCIE